MTSIKRNLEGESMVRVEPSARERRRAEEALHASEERYRRLLELASDAIVLHSDGELVLANEAAARLFGASGPELLLGKPIGDFVAAKDRSAIQKGSRKLAVSSGSTPFVRRKLIRVDGTRFDAEVAASPCSYDDKPAVQLVVRNVAERKQVEHHLSYLAQYDLLTRLPNRTQFRDRLGGALARANRNERLAAVVFLDLDHFQQVDNYDPCDPWAASPVVLSIRLQRRIHNTAPVLRCRRLIESGTLETCKGYRAKADPTRRRTFPASNPGRTLCFSLAAPDHCKLLVTSTP